MTESDGITAETLADIAVNAEDRRDKAAHKLLHAALIAGGPQVLPIFRHYLSGFPSEAEFNGV